ncbi:MAG: arginine--tRNA ligase [Spirochaetaceae bacterium]|nr:arginine--tRNA ligase [Spirochaetaceae bacterium]
MIDRKNYWKQRILELLLAFGAEKEIKGQNLSLPDIVAEVPPDPAMGDLGFPMFSYAKLFRMNPALLAASISQRIAAGKEPDSPAAKDLAKAQGPYLNIFFDREQITSEILERGSSLSWNDSKPMAGKRVMVEFSCPNTNKPLHLGHLRNNVLGESLSRILKEAGAEVRKVNLINDRGVHICKSMLAYKVYGQGHSPQDEGLKSDHFVGKYYVLFNQLKTEDPAAEEKAQAMLKKWEEGDPETLRLWKQMNEWAISGIKATYARQGVGFDKYYFESQTYMKGKAEVLEGLKKGIFYQDEDGSIWVNLEDVGLDRKVLLRKDGTSLYITQDIGTAIYRHDDWAFDRLIYVVASEQQYHFKVLFEVLKRLGFDWASNLYHLSYGLVNLPSGRMKTREGTVVDADDLIDELTDLAKEEISQKGRDDEVGDAGSVSEKVALGALHYYLLQSVPTKDMLYDPQQSLSFTGDTGPYIQYMGARACSILRKYGNGEGNARNGKASLAALSGEGDWSLVRKLALFSGNLELSARMMEPSVMAAYAHDLAAEFSSWYRDNPVLNSPDPDLSASRVLLVGAVRNTLKTVCDMLCIPFLELM